MTLLSRFGGMIRDVIIGRVFGNTVLGASFLAAFQFPNLFRRLFGEGALSAAFIPAYAEAMADRADPRAGDRLATLTLAILGAITGALTIVGEVVLLVLLLALPPDPERELSLRLIMVVLPYMPLICAAAILAGMLQSHGKYGAASAGPVLLNAFMIVVGGYFLLTQREAGEWVAYVMSAAIVLSGVTQCMWFLKVLRGHVRWTVDYAAATDRARGMMRRFVPVAIGLGALQLSTFADTMIAMYPIWVGPTILGHAYPLAESANSVLALTARLYQFPLGVFGIAVATAVFPLLARTAKEPALFLDTLRRGVRLSLFIGIPASVGLAIIRRDITYVLFAGGSSGFDDAGAASAADVLLGYSAAIWAYSLNHVLVRAFYARGDTVTPMKISLGAVALNIALNMTLIWWMREAGIAWATSISAIVQCAVLALLLRRRLRDTGAVFGPEVLSGIARIVGASVIMGVLTAGAVHLLGVPSTWTEHLVALVIGVLVGGATFGGAALALRMKELRWLLSRGS